MNQRQNLYQILGIEKNVSQGEIVRRVSEVRPDKNPEAGKALMILSDPQKRQEYDNNGWKTEWDNEWVEKNRVCSYAFEEIMESMYYRDEKTPDGVGIWVSDKELDSNLWAPYNKGEESSWVSKTYSFFYPEKGVEIEKVD